MKPETQPRRFEADSLIDAACRRIRDVQTATGAIPWFEGGVFDPWNHVEAAMALGVGGHRSAAERAFDRLAETQTCYGAWWGAYGNAVPMHDHVQMERAPGPEVIDTNFTAYVAAGVWHLYRLTGARQMLVRYWPMVDRALDFVVAQQLPGGGIAWCVDADGRPAQEALRAGSSSVYFSLGCGLAAAGALGLSRPGWQQARARLGAALSLTQPQATAAQFAAKSRYSMDWYYPVLCGAIGGAQARQHLAEGWARYVRPGLGCLCVDDAPWVTVAETAERALAIAATGNRLRAREVLGWALPWRDDSGAFWMGYQYEEGIVWPAERPAWTAAAVVLAVDALYGLTPASTVFTAPQAGITARVKCA